MLNTIKIKNKVINELIKHSKKIQSQSPIKNNYNNLIKNYDILNNIDCLALDNYILPKWKEKNLFQGKLKK